jgi:hypothetical protein
MNDPFWYDDISIIWKKERLNEFFPSASHTLEERFNAMLRLSLYISVILYVYHNNYKYFYIAFGVALFTFYIYKNRPANKQAGELKQIEEFEGKKCVRPTLDNPFMNVTMKDYMNIKDNSIVERDPACDISDPEIKKEIEENFNNNLYRDVDDVFGKMNSQRQFYTMPSTTIPNKQDEFAKWLYLAPKTCKEDNDYCLRYEDVRAKRPVLMDPSKNPVN